MKGVGTPRFTAMTIALVMAAAGVGLFLFYDLYPLGLAACPSATW